MMLPRILESEWMDTAEDAREYDSMDHAAVNAQYVGDLLPAISDWSRQPAAPLGIGHSSLRILDLGAGTAQISIELCRRAPQARLTAVDAAESMLILARDNIADAGLADHIDTVQADAKSLPFAPASFPVVISNSILHHVPDPVCVIAEAVRVVAPSGLLFHRDLCRPRDESHLEQLVTEYAGAATQYQRRLFADSLRAALTLDEIRDLVATFGFPPGTVRMTSDRHWTWLATLHE